MPLHANQLQQQHQIRCFFNHQGGSDKTKLLQILLDELIILNEAITGINSNDEEGLANLFHKLKGIVSYLMMGDKPIFYNDQSKVELLLMVQVLHDEILVIADEI
jgi:hypothetical protein